MKQTLAYSAIFIDIKNKYVANNSTKSQIKVTSHGVFYNQNLIQILKPPDNKKRNA